MPFIFQRVPCLPAGLMVLMLPRSLQESADEVQNALDEVVFNDMTSPVQQSKAEKAVLIKALDAKAKACGKQLAKLKGQLARISNSANKAALSKEKDQLDQLVDTAEALTNLCRLMKQKNESTMAKNMHMWMMSHAGATTANHDGPIVNASSRK